MSTEQESRMLLCGFFIWTENDRKKEPSKKKDILHETELYDKLDGI